MRLVLLVAVLLGLSAAPASAATGTYLRLGHLSQEPGRVDITVTASANPGSPVRVPDVEYGSLLDYRRIEPGSYAITMRPAGADPSSAPLYSATLQADTGKAYTAVDLNKEGKTLEDDISLPAGGQARIRVINAGGAEIDVVRGGTAISRNAAAGTAGTYSPIAPGTERIQVLPRGGEPINVSATIEAGGVYTVLATTSGATLRTDAKGAEVVPGGGQETGFGGMAPGGPGFDWRLVAISSLLVCAGLAYFRRRLFRFG